MPILLLCTLTQSWKTGSQILALLIGASWQEADAVRKLPPEGVLGLWVSVNVQVIASTDTAFSEHQLFSLNPIFCWGADETGEESIHFFLPQWKILTSIFQYAHNGPGLLHSIRPREEPMWVNFQNWRFILKLLPPLNSFWSHLVSQKNSWGGKPIEVKEADHFVSLCMVTTSAVVVSILPNLY